ncbi:MAG: hypothetical protein Mars2KO_12870 [Maribacter sp.]
MKKNQATVIFSLVLLLFSCKKDDDTVKVPEVEPGTVPFIFTINALYDDARVGFYLALNTYDYNYTIDWGDGTIDENQTSSPNHFYKEKGTYKISITGELPQFFAEDFMYHDENGYNVIALNQWGNIEWESLDSVFSECSELINLADDIPNLKNVVSMRNMFQNATRFNADLNDWDVSQVTNMVSAFKGASSFNGDLNNWDVGKVTDMRNMFQNATSFNRDLNNRDVRKVTLMNNMFEGATKFNGNIADWDLRNLQQMTSMFAGAEAFNSNISRWNVGNVSITARMFEDATSFNQDISNWDMRKNGITTGMFKGATSFNQDIGNWDTSNFQQVQYMFSEASQFNTDIGNWNMHVADDMRNMFDGATSFDQDLGNWNLMSADKMENMFDDSGLSTTNYDATLKGWSEQDKLKSYVILGAEGLGYCDNGETARQILINNKGWVINGDTKSAICN